MPELSKVALQVDSNQSFPNNNNGYITPAILRSYNTNVIDSTVNQIQYTADSGSWNSKIDGINVQTASFQAKFNTIGSQSGSWITESETGSFARTNSTNTFTGNQIVIGDVSASFFSGDGSGLYNVPGAQPLTDLNAFTASQDTKNITLATYTGSIDTKFTTIGSASGSWINTGLNTFTQSQDTKNSTLSTYTASVDTKFSTIGSQSGSWDNTSLNFFTQSQDTKNSTLATYTGSVDTKFTTIGVSTASLNSFTSSQDTKNSTLATYTGSVDTKFTAIGNTTASLNAFTSSQNTKNSTLATYTGSVDTKFTTLSSSTASLNTYTASLITAFTASGTNITVNGITTLKSNLIVTGSTTLSGDANIIGNTFISGTLNISGSTIISGSARGIVLTQTIASTTASFDFSTANFFELTLVSGSNTSVIANNIKPGQTINVLVQQPAIGTGTISFGTQFKFPEASAYTASASSNAIDILTFITYNTGSVYSVGINKFV
jgi:hypothetical protein